MRRVLMALTLVIILVATWLAFTVGEVVPGETETNITVEKNILYVHVPSAICTTFCFIVLLVAGIGYLITEKPKWDRLGGASGEVAFVFATVLNITGSIFAHPFWGWWWRPTPRLLSSAILWFLCVAYLILRTNIQNVRQRARICAVFGIIAFLDVPIVLAAGRVRQSQHIGNMEVGSAAMGAALGLSILGIVMLASLLIWLKTDIMKNKAEFESDLTY